MNPDFPARASLAAVIRHNLEAIQRMDGDLDRLLGLVEGWKMQKEPVFRAFEAFIQWLSAGGEPA